MTENDSFFYAFAANPGFIETPMNIQCKNAERVHTLIYWCIARYFKIAKWWRLLQSGLLITRPLWEYHAHRNADPATQPHRVGD